MNYPSLHTETLRHRMATVRISTAESGPALQIKDRIRAVLDQVDDESPIISYAIGEPSAAMQNYSTSFSVSSNLRRYRRRLGYTQRQLASFIGAQQHHISEMETNKRGIGKRMAERLGKVLLTDYHRFL